MPCSKACLSRAQYTHNVSVYRFGRKEVRWGVPYNSNWVQLSFTTLLNIVRFDLRNIYFTVGDSVLRQHNGAPIGGFISALYGNVVCAKAEYDYLNSLGADQKLLAALRCQDDALTFVVYEPDQPESKAKAERIRADFLENRVYKGGLQVKEVPIVNHCAKFVGTIVTTNIRPLRCTAFNRNWESFNSNNSKQQIPRFHPALSYTDNRNKRGVMVGAFRRVRKQTTWDAEAIGEAIKLRLEFLILHYRPAVVLQALKVLARKTQSGHRSETDIERKAEQKRECVSERQGRCESERGVDSEERESDWKRSPEFWVSVQNIVEALMKMHA
jgi:hypothetical protein